MGGYDYVIVGAGSAGCVLAARLTEDPDVSVCLIEAGPPDAADEIHLPAGVLRSAPRNTTGRSSRIPSPGSPGASGCCRAGARSAAPHRSTRWSTSAATAPTTTSWAAMGLDGWGWDDVLPYFIRAEDNERGACELHGAGGPLRVSEGRPRYRTCEAFIEAGLQAGMAATDDFNGVEQDGVGWYQLTQRDGMRCSAAVAYLHPVLARQNLTLITGAHVTRLLLDGTAGRRGGDRPGGELSSVEAEREVILLGRRLPEPADPAAVGVGPAEDLALVNIPWAQELPVGQGLQDHPSTLDHLHHRRGVAAQRRERGEPGAAHHRGPRAADLQLRRVRWVLPHRRRAGRPRHPAPPIPILFPEAGAAEILVDGWAISACLLRPTSRGFVNSARRVPTPSRGSSTTTSSPRGPGGADQGVRRGC